MIPGGFIGIGETRSFVHMFITNSIFFGEMGITLLFPTCGRMQMLIKSLDGVYVRDL